MFKDFIRLKFEHNRRCVFIWTIYSFLIFFKIIGLLTPTVKNASNQKDENLRFINIKPSKLGIVYNVVLIILWIVSHSFTMQSRNFFDYPGRSAVTDNTGKLHVILSIVTNSALLLSYCINQKKMVQLGNEFIEIEKTFNEVEVLHYRQRIRCRTVLYSILYFLILVFQIIASLKQYCTNSISLTVINSWALDIIVLCLSCFCVVQYFFAVVFIRGKFIKMNDSMKLLLTSFKLECSRRFFTENRQMVSRVSFITEITVLKDLCNRLLKISSIVNETFSVPILLSLTYLFGCLINTAFYTVVILVSDDAKHLANIISPITCLISIIMSISLLTFAVTGLRQEVAKTARILHNILNSTNDRKLTSELKLFSLLLLHEKPSFTACGFFELDCSLLHSIIGAFTTYIVILVQFQTSGT